VIGNFENVIHSFLEYLGCIFNAKWHEYPLIVSLRGELKEVKGMLYSSIKTIAIHFCSTFFRTKKALESY